MEIRALQCAGDEPAVWLADPAAAPPEARWVWIDMVVRPEDTPEMVAITGGLGLDTLAVLDAVLDLDLPKIDDFDTSLLVILHGLTADRVATYELDCFITEDHLVTIHRERSPSVDALWEGIQRRPELAAGGPDQVLARLADVVTRRLVTVLDVFDRRIDGLIELALRADDRLLVEVTAVRADLAALRRVVHPQREVLDVLRRSTSPLMSEAGRRRSSDVFDVATRAAQGHDAARAALAETLDAYRGAEARQATEVTKVLTVYAAIMLPLSLIAGFFGMNFPNLPGADSDRGWIWAAALMGLVAVVSLGIFVSLGWIRRPSGRSAGEVLGHGLVEAARAPAQLVGAVFEISTMPLRGIARVPRRSDNR